MRVAHTPTNPLKGHASCTQFIKTVGDMYGTGRTHMYHCYTRRLRVLHATPHATSAGPARKRARDTTDSYSGQSFCNILHASGDAIVLSNKWCVVVKKATEMCIGYAWIAKYSWNGWGTSKCAVPIRSAMCSVRWFLKDFQSGHSRIELSKIASIGNLQ